MQARLKNNNLIISRKKTSLIKRIAKNYELYLLLLPVIVYYAIFNYVPMYGIQIAFKNYTISEGIWGSPWIGFDYFMRFFNSYNFWDLIKNTIGISIYSLIVVFPVTIVFSLMLNEVKNKHFMKSVQTITYAPHFISTVVMVGIMITFLSTNGPVNMLLKFCGKESIRFLEIPEYFKTIYVLSGLWQNIGWGSIIYLSTLSGVSPELHEAATIDGATKMQKILNIDIPAIIPTATIMLIMNVGSIMNVGFEKVFLMQNPLNMSGADVISTYVYRVGMISAEYSFSTAIGLFNSIINLLLMIFVNYISRRVSETSLW